MFIGNISAFQHEGEPLQGSDKKWFHVFQEQKFKNMLSGVQLMDALRMVPSPEAIFPGMPDTESTPCSAGEQDGAQDRRCQGQTPPLSCEDVWSWSAEEKLHIVDDLNDYVVVD